MTPHQHLGPHCRDHDPPALTTVGGQRVWICPSCGACISDRDVRGAAYPESLPARRERHRREFEAKAKAGAEKRSSRYIPSSMAPTKLTRQVVRDVVRRYRTCEQMAAAMGVARSSLVRAAERFGIEIPRTRRAGSAGRPIKITREMILAGMEQGHTIIMIASKLGVSAEGVYGAARRYGIETPRAKKAKERSQ